LVGEVVVPVLDSDPVPLVLPVPDEDCEVCMVSNCWYHQFGLPATLAIDMALSPVVCRAHSMRRAKVPGGEAAAMGQVFRGRRRLPRRICRAILPEGPDHTAGGCVGNKSRVFRSTARELAS
jgi:hypothetical protein